MPPPGFHCLCVYCFHSGKPLHSVSTVANPIHPAQVSILSWSFWDPLSGLVGPVWKEVPEPLVSTSFGACAMWHLPILFLPLGLKAPPGQSCDFHPKHFAEGLTYSRCSRWWLPEWLCHVTHLQKYFSGYIVFYHVLGSTIYLTILFLLQSPFGWEREEVV